MNTAYAHFVCHDCKVMFPTLVLFLHRKELVSRKMWKKIQRSTNVPSRNFYAFPSFSIIKQSSISLIFLWHNKSIAFPLLLIVFLSNLKKCDFSITSSQNKCEDSASTDSVLCKQSYCSFCASSPLRNPV